MTTWSDAFSGRPEAVLYLDVTDGSPNTTSNTSVVSFTLRVVGNNASWNLSNGTYSVTIDGTNYTGSWNYDFRVDNTETLRTGTKTITHDTNGNKSITVSATATDAGGSPLGTATITSKTFTTNPLPGTPSAAPTLTRDSAGTTITVLSATSGTTATVTDYEYRQSTDGSTWGTNVSMGTDRTIDVTGLTATQQYYYQTRVKTADGVGPWSASADVVGIPTAPASITATRTNRDVAVVAGNATGTGITGYWVQNSSNGGSTWSTAVAMTSQAYTYTNLTPGQTYLFRVYATNSIGNSAFTTSGSVFIPAGGKRWDGSAWIYATTAKRWDGSAWVDLTVAKRWDGTSWTDLS